MDGETLRLESPFLEILTSFSDFSDATEWLSSGADLGGFDSLVAVNRPIRNS